MPSTPTPEHQHAMVDANVLLRLFTGEPRVQADASRRLMARADAGDLLLHICPLIVAEVVWVLTSVYEQPVAAVSRVLTDFLASGGLVVEEGLQIAAALREMEHRGVDFADGYLAARARLGPMNVASFDKDFERLGVERMALG